MDDGGNMHDEQIGHRGWGRLWWLWWPLGSLALVAGLVFIAFSWRDSTARAKVDRELERLKTLQLPVDNASLVKYYERLTGDKEIDAWMSVLASVDSAEFREACAAVYPWDGTLQALPPPGEPWPEEAQTVAFLRRYTDLRTQAHRLAAADVPRRTPIRFDGPATLLPAANSVRDLARLFQLEAQMAIRRRDSAQTRQAILALMGCSRSVEGQPFMVSQLVGLATYGMAVEQIRSAVADDVLNSVDLRVVLARVDARTPWPELWRTGIDGERASMLSVFRDPARYMPSLGVSDFGFNIPWRSRDILTYLEITRQAAELPTDDLATFQQATLDLEQDMRDRFSNTSPMVVFDQLISRLATPGYAAYGVAFVQREMASQLATLSLGVRLYEDRFGSFPNALDDLNQIGIYTANLMPPGGSPYGYKIDEGGHCKLWGFNIRQQTSTPAEPPVAATPDQASETWIWQLNRRAQ